MYHLLILDEIANLIVRVAGLVKKALIGSVAERRDNAAGTRTVAVEELFGTLGAEHPGVSEYP